MESFSYSPLLPPLADGTPSIRLVEIEPGDEAAIISARLMDAHLEPELEYESLSYCWGKDINKKEILLNGVVFEVTQNLHDALQRLRILKTSRRLWIDAICVNQMDLDERSRQVQLMRKIFQGTQMGLIWLGDAPRNLDLGLSLIAKLNELRVEGVSFTEINFREQQRERKDHGLPDRLDSSWYALNDFLALPWFKRVWTVQEAALPKSVRFLCGDKEIDWDEIFRAIKYATDFNMVGSPQPIRSVSSLFVNTGFLREFIQNNTPWSFAVLLCLFKERLATDRRDHIFATLGLLSETELASVNIDPNYYSSTTEVFNSATIYVLEWMERLDILKLVTPEQYEDSPLGLPSWGVDWTSERNHSDIVGHCHYTKGRGMFGATDATNYVPDRSGLQGQLILRGMEIDRVLYIAGEFRYLKSGSFDISVWRNSARQLLKEMIGKRQPTVDLALGNLQIGDESPMRPQETQDAGLLHDFDRAFTSTIMGGVDPSSSIYPFSDDFAARFEPTDEDVEEIMELINELSKLTGDTDPWRNVVFQGSRTVDIFKAYESHCKHRRLIITAEGKLGLVPDDTDEGDLIFLLVGGDVPFVLRPAGNDTYTFIGHCYVHGVMDGEAFDETKCEKVVLV